MVQSHLIYDVTGVLDNQSVSYALTMSSRALTVVLTVVRLSLGLLRVSMSLAVIFT